jgi:hypothetical protein
LCSFFEGERMEGELSTAEEEEEEEREMIGRVIEVAEGVDEMEGLLL